MRPSVLRLRLPSVRALLGVVLLGTLLLPGGSSPAPAAAAGCAATPPSGGPPLPGLRLVWSDDFNSPPQPDRWNMRATTAFRYGTHNPRDNKLDWIDPSAVHVSCGIAELTARPGPHRLPHRTRAWSTGLLTTEATPDRFLLRPGDFTEVRLQLPTAPGAWPALWTWRNGGNEVDSFEYHPDRPHLLELSNRVRGGQAYRSDPAIAPGAWVVIGTRYGAGSVDWYLDRRLVFRDHRGVGRSWSAYLVLNLSVSAGRYHRAPGSARPFTLAVDYLRVYRAGAA
ncbi:glycoside hydrolase family 16 protein [Streptacidiphilus monticola]|uniref:Beta-glucanase n=1 Tax=Streptacidiphilus monticola TaxID=2161674 RepID=A0ABW1G5U2_9ACTN